MLLTAPLSLTFLISLVSATCLHNYQVADQTGLCVRLVDNEWSMKWMFYEVILSLFVVGKVCVNESGLFNIQLYYNIFRDREINTLLAFL